MNLKWKIICGIQWKVNSNDRKPKFKRKAHTQRKRDSPSSIDSYEREEKTSFYCY